MSPKSIYYVPGVTVKSPCLRRKLRDGGLGHDTEDILIQKEDEITIREGQTLCERNGLPQGINCNQRLENGGYYFCTGNKRNCPLSKERV